MVVVDAPKVERAAAEKVPPRLAKLLLEKKKVEPPKVIEPPKPEPEKPKPEEKKPEPEKPKPEPKPEPEKAPPPKPKVDIEAARKKASSAGVLAMKDMLADLREAEPAETIQQSTQKLQTGGSEERVTTRSILTSKATKGSGGIDTSKFSRDIGGSTALQGHETATVVSRLDNLPAAQEQKQDEEQAKKTGGRSEGEIQRIMETNKPGIWSIYQRALRQNPGLQGKVVFKITIEPSGEVSNCELVSSELHDTELEHKLMLRIKRINFKARDVETTVITYPFDFLPIS